MDLQKNELRELDRLRAMLHQPRFMSQEEHDRLDHLNKKQIHGCCSNPHCTGFHEAETKPGIKHCPICGDDLFLFKQFET